MAPDQACPRAGAPAVGSCVPGRTASGKAWAPGHRLRDSRRAAHDREQRLGSVRAHRDAEALLRGSDVGVAAPAEGGAAEPRSAHAPAGIAARARAGPLGRHVPPLVELVRPRLEHPAQQPGRPPKALVLSAPGGGRISIASNLLHHQATTPICQAPGGSTLDASRFTPIVPQGPPSSALPLGARIVSSGQVPHVGAWLSYTLVLTNRSARPFSFGRGCPAYEEGFGLRAEAYVLNCHAVGTIAPHAAARFAMRIRVPTRVWGKVLTWTLAPHSWNPPSASKTLRR